MTMSFFDVKGLAVLFKQMVPVNSILKQLLNVHTMTAAFLNMGILGCNFAEDWQFILDWAGWDKHPQHFEGFIYYKKALHVTISSISSCLCPV